MVTGESGILMNEGIKINIKPVRRIIKTNNLQLLYARYKNRTDKRNITKPLDINPLREDINYVSTSNGMYYLII